MGDRSNVVIETKFNEENSSRVYLYSHWAGTSVLESVLHGLRSNRVDDPPYLARIIFDHMIRNDHGGETGYGISSYITDNEHPILVITCDWSSTGTTVHFEDVQGDRIVDPVSVDKFLAAEALVTSTNYYSFQQVMHVVWGTPADEDYDNE